MEKGILFANFLQKNADSSKAEGVLSLQVYFLKLNVCLNLPTKFQVSDITITSLERGTPPFPHLKMTPENAQPHITKSLNHYLYQVTH